MTRRRRWPLWLRCARHARLVRLHPGDTLVLVYPGPLPADHAEQVVRTFEQAIGWEHDVRVVAVDCGPEISVIREIP